MSLRNLPPHDVLDDESKELASLHALAALSAEEAADYEEHLRACELCRRESALQRATAEQLAEAAPTAEPSADLKRRLFGRLGLPLDGETSALEDDAPSRVWRAWADDADRAAPATFLPAGSGDFEATRFEGVSARRLFVDRERDQVTMLIRMEAGSSYPAHVHGGPEECFVLEGDLHVGDELHMHAGDFQRVEGGQPHPVQSTDEGCLLLIMSSLHDELIEGTV